MIDTNKKQPRGCVYWAVVILIGLPLMIVGGSFLLSLIGIGLTLAVGPEEAEPARHPGGQFLERPADMPPIVLPDLTEPPRQRVR